jgi:beta-lactamase regulating signal transducer with metallopeptidase domain
MTLSKSPNVSVERLIALQSCSFSLRERTAAVLGVLFAILVMVASQTPISVAAACMIS